MNGKNLIGGSYEEHYLKDRTLYLMNGGKAENNIDLMILDEL